jgi:hypothetical protein
MCACGSRALTDCKCKVGVHFYLQVHTCGVSRGWCAPTGRPVPACTSRARYGKSELTQAAHVPTRFGRQVHVFPLLELVHHRVVPTMASSHLHVHHASPLEPRLHGLLHVFPSTCLASPLKICHVTGRPPIHRQWSSFLSLLRSQPRKLPKPPVNPQPVPRPTRCR